MLKNRSKICEYILCEMEYISEGSLNRHIMKCIKLFKFDEKIELNIKWYHSISIGKAIPTLWGNITLTEQYLSPFMSVLRIGDRQTDETEMIDIDPLQVESTWLIIWKMRYY